MTSSFQQVLFISFVLVLVMQLSNTNCQRGLIKQSYFSDQNCTTSPTSTLFWDTGFPCKPPPQRCHTSSYNNLTNYHTIECITELPPIESSYGFISIYWYEPDSKCTDPLAEVWIHPTNTCIRKVDASYFEMYDNNGNQMEFYDDKCTKKKSSTTLTLNQCVSESSIYTTLGTPQSQPYKKTGYYNGKLSGGGATCKSGVFSQVYTPVPICQSQACKQIDVNMPGEKMYQNVDCVTGVPMTAANNSYHVYTHFDQNTCQSQTAVTRLEVYSINSCSPYVMNSKNLTETVYIKIEDCKFMKKYNDSSCLNVISQVDLSTRNGVCDSSGVRFLCNSDRRGGGGGFVGNSTINSAGERMHQLSSSFVVHSIILILLSIIFTI